MQLPSVFSNYQQRINEKLETALASEVIEPRLKKTMAHGVLLGGKRVRPCLVYMLGDMLDCDLDKLDAVAVSVELIHAYSLIHDDLPAMDDDALRRGKPTCHIAFDEANAILAGDALQSLAFKILADADDLADTLKAQLTTQLSHAAFAMCNGQALDLQATNQSLTESELTKLHQQKTGAMITASVLMGATASGLKDTNHFEALKKYADLVGLAYQIRDDVLDVISDTTTLGKPQGSDQQLNKPTYSAVLGLEKAQQKADLLLNQALQVISALPYNTQPLSEFAQFVVQRSY